MRIALCLLASSLMLPVTSNSPQDPAPAAVRQEPAGIGFVDIQEAIDSCEEGKVESIKWQQDVEARNAELQKLQQEVDVLQTKLDVTGTKLNDDARAELVQELDEKATALQFQQQSARRAVEFSRQRYQASILRKMRPVVADMAKERRLTAVLFIGGQMDGYFDPASVMTEELVAAYNQAYPVSAPVKK